MTLCECGCGLPTTVSKQSDTKRGYVRGVAMRYRQGHAPRTRPTGTPRHRYVHTPDGRYIGAHVYAAEKALGRVLPPLVDVHHIDGNPDNNANTNLVICQDRAYHKLLHVRTRVVKAGGDPNTDRLCGRCGMTKTFDCFNRAAAHKSTGLTATCRECAKAIYYVWRKQKKAAA